MRFYFSIPAAGQPGALAYRPMSLGAGDQSRYRAVGSPRNGGSSKEA
jgi:hypothetical protein